MSATVSLDTRALAGRAARGGALGAGASFVAGLADVASTVGWLADPLERVRLIVTLVAVAAGTGAWLGAVLALLYATAKGDAVQSLRTVFLRSVAIVGVPLGLVAWRLFSGGRARRVPALVIVRPITWIVLVVVSAVLITGCAALARRARSTRTAIRFASAAIFFVAALVLHAADHRILPRLYEYLHVGLGIGTALCAGAALYISTPVVASLRAIASLWIGAALAAPIGFLLLGRWDNVRAEVFGVHAPFVRHAALAIESVRPAPARRPHTRARVDALVDASNLPSVPGASLLLITIDALRDDRLRPDLAPHLSAVAAQGIRLRRTYAQAPHSSYSIASLHTSEYLHETVPLGQSQPLTTLADSLGQAGYYTAAFYTNGIFFTEGERLTVYRDRAFGFRRADHVDRRADAQAEAAMREIDDVVRRGAARTFLWVHFFDTHEPYGGSGPTPQARYDDAVRHVDAAAGELIAYARAHLSPDLVVAITADHGEEFGEHGGVYHGSSVYEEQVRVPLVIAGPGIPRGATLDVAAQLVDLGPTLEGLLAIARTGSMRGQDLRPWIMGREHSTRHAFSAVNTRSMVTDGHDKLVVDRRYDVRELYDLSSDPAETRNLASTARARADALDASLDAWSEDLGGRAAGRAVLARGRMGNRAAIPELLALASDQRELDAHRTEAIDVLGGFDDAAVSAPLRALLTDPSRDVADAAACALGSTGHSIARDRLLDALARDEPTTRRRAASALARLREPAALAVLMEQVFDLDETARVEAVDGLGAIGAPEAVPVLEEVLADDHLRYRAVLALGRIGGREVLDRLESIARNDRADDVRANAGAALGLADDRSRVASLQQLARDDAAQSYVANALARLGAGIYDAREDATSHCTPVDDTLAWRLLRARRCDFEEPRTFVVAPGSAGHLMLIVRARGAGVLRFDDPRNEIAHVDLEPGDREWRIPLSARPAWIRVRTEGNASITHVVIVP